MSSATMRHCGCERCCNCNKTRAEQETESCRDLIDPMTRTPYARKVAMVDASWKERALQAEADRDNERSSVAAFLLSNACNDLVHPRRAASEDGQRYIERMAELVRNGAHAEEDWTPLLTWKERAEKAEQRVAELDAECAGYVMELKRHTDPVYDPDAVRALLAEIDRCNDWPHISAAAKRVRETERK